MLTEKTLRKLSGIEKCSKSGKHRVQDLFKIATESPCLWMQAYTNLASNKGTMTPGIDEQTIDGHSLERSREIITLLKENKYVPKPSKRVYVPKNNGKLRNSGSSGKRPLGIPCYSDKLVQEVWRILLERVYEPIFNKDSHGFRPERSCHTALKNIRNVWNGTKWFIEFDIKGCFDNIDHQKLIEILERRINDPKFIRIIKLMLKAGYVERWQYHKTYSGTPQGGICSPILANIYLHELDKIINNIQTKYTIGKNRKANLNYKRIGDRKIFISRKINKLRKEGDTQSAKKLFEAWKSYAE